MNKMKSLNGALTNYIVNEGYDSRMVLDAINAVLGGIKPDPEKTKCTQKAKESGRVLKDGEDKRVVTISESYRMSAKTPRTAATALAAVSTQLDALNDKNISVKVTELDAEIEVWFRRESWLLAKVDARASSRAESCETSNDTATANELDGSVVSVPGEVSE